MWGSFCSCPVPCAAICYRRCVPCGSPCCSYASATLPPSSIPVDPTIYKKRCKKKKKKSKNIQDWSKSDLENITPSQLALMSESAQELIIKKMQEAGMALDKFAAAGIQAATQRSGYAGSEGGFVTRRCDPRCRARRSRPATAGCTPRQPVKDLCPSKYNTSNYCGVGGLHRSDASTATDIKTNASTSTNHLDLFCGAQRAGGNSLRCNTCGNPQGMQQQYNQALQQQWLQKCYYCQMMAQQNPFKFNNLPPVLPNMVESSVQRVFPQSRAQSQNSFQQGAIPYSPIFSGSFSFPSNQALTCQSMLLSLPGVGTPGNPEYVTPIGKKCQTCGRIRK